MSQLFSESRQKPASILEIEGDYLLALHNSDDFIYLLSVWWSTYNVQLQFVVWLSTFALNAPWFTFSLLCIKFVFFFFIVVLCHVCWTSSSITIEIFVRVAGAATVHIELWFGLSFFQTIDTNKYRSSNGSCSFRSFVAQQLDIKKNSGTFSARSSEIMKPPWMDLTKSQSYSNNLSIGKRQRIKYCA